MTTTITGAGGVSQVQAGAIEHGDLPSGSVLQVVQVTSNSSTTPTASWTAVAGGAITIAPSATSSKVMVTFTSGGMSNGTANDIQIRLVRGSTVVRSISRYGYEGPNDWTACPLTLSYLDSPSTTSATTYSIEVLTNLNNDFRINNNQQDDGGLNGVVTIAMEIRG